MVTRWDPPYEERFARVLREIEECSQLDLLRTEQGREANPAARDAARMFDLAAERGISLDPALQECYFPNENLAIAWRSKAHDIGGEFNVYNIVSALDLDVPYDDYARNDAEYELLSDTRILDDLFWGGGGRLAALRFLPNRTRPEIWYLEPDLGPLLLDIGYCDYLNNVLTTKGVTGWQLLFASVDLAANGQYSPYLEKIQTMLQVLPVLFPEHDYAPLRARLEERL